MTFPTVENVLTQTFSPALTSHAVNMPVTVNAGDLLLICAAIYSSGSDYLSGGTPSGWTQIAHEYDSGELGEGVSIYAKVADGSEAGGTATVTTTADKRMAVQVIRVSGWSGALSGVEVSATATNPQGSATYSADPNSLSPSWGADDTLWIVLGGSTHDADWSGAPSNYSANLTSIRVPDAGPGEHGATVGSSYRTNNAASEDPGAFTLSSADFWSVWTLAVAPQGGSEGPVLESAISDQAAVRANTYELSAGAHFSSSLTMSFTATGLPAGFSIDEATGVLTPDAAGNLVQESDISTVAYDVAVVAGDASGATTASFALTVRHPQIQFRQDNGSEIYEQDGTTLRSHDSGVVWFFCNDYPSTSNVPIADGIDASLSASGQISIDLTIADPPSVGQSGYIGMKFPDGDQLPPVYVVIE